MQRSGLVSQQALALAILSFAAVSPANAAYLPAGQAAGRATPAASAGSQAPKPEEPKSGAAPASQPAASTPSKPSQEAAPSQPASQSAGQPVQPSVPTVTDAYNLAYPDPKDPDHKTAAIDDL
ncbi:MAG TPA: hypothetical protein VFV34_17950, partial [Blastocatellia bacterium]|nr:hypothetical protein [Blastocatellia bacterium]